MSDPVVLQIMRMTANLMEHMAERPACDGRTRHTLRKAVSDIREHIAVLEKSTGDEAVATS